MLSPSSLFARRRELLQRLPPVEQTLRGSFFVRRRRCGDSRCRCTRSAGHRTAYIAVTLADGTSEQISLPRELEGLARQWVASYRRFWQTAERLWAVNRDLLRGRLLRRDG